MKKLIAKRWLFCLCVLPWLSACGVATRHAKPPTPLMSQPVTRTQVIEVPIEVPVPLDRSLTEPLREPPPPAAHCVLNGVPLVCVSDALAWIELWRGTLQRANNDRATAARITTPRPAKKGSANDR